MGQIFAKDEQYLFQTAAIPNPEDRTREAESGSSLAEFAKTLHRRTTAPPDQSESRRCFPDLNCASSQRGRLPRPDQLSEGRSGFQILLLPVGRADVLA